MLIQILLVVTGFVCLIFGANWLVDGASALAKKYNVSDLAIGLTIVAFGTSAPELVVNIIGALNGYSDIVLGNIVGSNNFNLFIILGITGLIMPIAVQSSTVHKEIPISLLAAVILLFLINDFSFSQPSFLSRVDGIVMLILFLFFLYYVYRQMKREPVIQTDIAQKSTFKIWILILLGLAGLVIGGQFVVLNSVEIANNLGVSEKIIGLTIVAAGTSLPELVTSIVAATKKNSDIAIENIVGSNIFNILLILSISTIVSPIEYNPKFNQDILILIGGTILLLLFMLSGRKKTVDRWEAGVLLGFYFCYTIYLVMDINHLDFSFTKIHTNL